MRRISLRAWFCGAIITAVSLHANAAGLGRLDVKSVLGEPLRAEVAVLSKPGEAGSLAVRLASPEAYQAAGLVHTGIVSQISVTLAKGAGEQPLISVTSAGPINEPVIDLLLELTWASGRITREYTVFIDPPFIVAEREKRRVEAAVAAAEAEDAARGAETQAASEPETPIATPLPEESVEVAGEEFSDEAETEGSQFAEEESDEFADEEGMEDDSAASLQEIDLGPVVTIGGTGPTLFSETPTVSTSVGATQDDYSGSASIKVKRGDTLSQIAISNKPAGVTLEQMLAVLYKKNPQAFSGNNMNRLRTGKIIQLAAPEEYSSVTSAEARKEVRVQSVDWNAYKERLAAATMMKPVGSEQEAQQVAGGSVTPKVEDRALTPLQESAEVVKLSRGEPAQMDKGATGGSPGNSALQEQLVASEKAVNEANARVARLEKIIVGLQKLEVENQKMAERQAQAEKAKTAGTEVAAPAVKPSEPAKPDVTPAAVTGSAQKSPAMESMPSSGPSQAVAPGPEAAAPADGQGANAVQAPGTMPPVPTGEATKTPAQAAQKPRRPPPPPPSPPSPSLLDQVLERPYLVAVPVLLVLLVGWGVAKMRGRKREVDQQPDEDAPAFEATAVMPAAGARGTFSPAETDVGLASNRAGAGADEVDPLEEAEIFLAYGRDAQAEELLKEAIVVHPARFEIHVKLLEIYAKQNNIEDFEKLAREVQQGTGGQGELWNRAVRLGYSIDPGNARYASGADGDYPERSGSQDLPHESSGTAEHLDFDVGFDDPAHSNTGTDIDLNATAEYERTSLMSAPTMDTQAMDTQVLDSPLLDDGGRSAFTEMDLNLELPVLGSETNSALESSVGQTSNSVDFDFDVDKFSEQVEPTERPDDSGALGADSGLDFDVGEITQNTITEYEEQSGSSDMGALDLSGISLDLDGATTTSLEISGKDEKWYEVQTKFDLAKAYQEMGDKDGAREILNEVVSEGDPEQQSAAQSVLATLD